VYAKADYSKYLGPDYVYRYDGATTVVTNHQCLMDLLINLAHLDPWASHLGKREALNIPLLKYAILPL